MQNNFAKLNTVLLSIVIVLLAIGIWMLSRKKDSGVTSVVSQTVSNTVNNPSDTSTVNSQQSQSLTSSDPLANWNVLSYEGVTFRYPTDWKIWQDKSEVRPGSGYWITQNYVGINGTATYVNFGTDVYAGANDPNSVYIIHQVGTISFFIPKDAPQSLVDTFNQIVGSAKAK